MADRKSPLGLLLRGILRRPEPAAPAPPPLKALVVADLMEEATAIANLLRALGLEAETTIGGELAMIRLQTGAPDLLYIDCWESRVDGLTLLKVAAHYTPDLPRRVVARIPGGAASEPGQELVELGVRTIAPRRLTVDALAEVVEQATGRAVDPERLARAREAFPARPEAKQRDEFVAGDLLGGHHRVVRTLGRGAFCTVYEVEDLELGGALRALKLLSATPPLPGADAMLLREYEVTRLVQHPNVVCGHDRGLHGERPWVTFDVVSGLSLQDWIDDQGTLPVGPESLALLSGGARAVEAMHHAGLAHLDIKPGNLLVDEATGLLKLIDFGASLLPDDSRESTGQVLGTPSYVSPEQLRGETAGTDRSDLFSLGVVLYEILTGRRPFRGVTVEQLLHRIATEPPVAPAAINPAIPSELSDTILLMLSKDPARRPTHCAEVLERLSGRSALDIVPTTAAERATEALFDFDFDEELDG
jgi:CheY-like chemotaxis protein